ALCGGAAHEKAGVPGQDRGGAAPRPRRAVFIHRDVWMRKKKSLPLRGGGARSATEKCWGSRDYHKSSAQRTAATPLSQPSAASSPQGEPLVRQKKWRLRISEASFVSHYL